jgi:putative ABC transport system permease protein
MLLFGVSVVALTVGVLSVFNTMLAVVLERRGELALMRALGASGGQVLGLLATEAILLTAAAAAIGLLGAIVGGPWLEEWLRGFVPFAPGESFLNITPGLALSCLAIGVGTGVLAVFYPAVLASRLTPARAARST